MKIWGGAILLVALAAMAHSQSEPQPRADPEAPAQIFLNGNIYAGAELGFGGRPARVLPRVQALAVGGGRIIAAGTNAEISKLRGPGTQVVDLGGRFVMPGFNDAHVHLDNGGFEKLNVNLVGAASLKEMQSRITARVASAAEGEWIVGRGWDHTLWPEQKLPTRYDLDQVTGKHPAIFTRVDGHIAVANSAALAAAGIAARTPDPPGGKIDRDEKGQPTGILRESAKDLVTSKVPRPSPSQRRRAIELALADAARWGLTSAQDNSQWEDFLVYEDLLREGKLTLRISEWLPFPAPLDTLERHRAHHEQGDVWLHTGMLKGFMDGSLGSRTAALLKPYADDPSNSGLPQYKQDELDQMTVLRTLSGFQIGFHAIGDRGVEMALNAFADAARAARSRGPNLPQNVRPSGFRFRVEHAQVVTPQQFARFHELGVIASMQPNHLLTDMNWAVERIGPERARTSYAWAEFLKNDVPLAFGTDYPVEPITPFRGLYAAVTRKNEAGTKEYFPEQKISIDQAIAAYTTGAAYAEFAENDKGTLRPGMLADFVVLDRDITRIAPADILKTRVLRTVVGGKTVYETNTAALTSKN